jgi:hypothetical protein
LGGYHRAGLCGLALLLALLINLVGGIRPESPQAVSAHYIQDTATQISYPGDHSAQEENLPVEEYWRLVETTLRQVDDLRNIPPDEAHERLAETAKQWESIDAVVLQDGATMPVDASFIAAQLAATPPNLESLDGLLSALLVEKDSWVKERFTPSDVNRLAPILARPEFQWTPDEPSPFQKFWLDLLERLQNLFSRLFGDRGIQISVPFLQYALVGLGLLIIIFMLIYVFSGISRALITEANLGTQAHVGDENLTADTALRLAQDLASSGDYRLAVRYLYLSSLLLLEERRLLRYDRSKTNREYLRSIAGHPELASVLKEVVDVFDRVWYGYQSLDQTTFEAYRNRIADLRQQK